MALTIKEKRLPVFTWNRQNVNEADLILNESKESLNDFVFVIPKNLDCTANFDAFDFSKDVSDVFLSKQAKKFIDQNANVKRYIKIPKNYTASEPIKISFNPNDNLNDDILIEAEENSRAVVIIEYNSAKQIAHSGRTRIYAHKNAHIELIKSQLLNEQSNHNDTISAFADDEANVKIVLAEMGAASVFLSCSIVLNGQNSKGDLQLVYLGTDDHSIDISAKLTQRGKKTKSLICAKGILMDNAKKILRNTLDFVSGCKGSAGREEENVLMLSDKAKNISVPVLLCGEEDVEGEHAASSGKPAEAVMFYLMSRGLSESDAQKLLAKGAFSVVLKTIPDESIKNKILNFVEKAFENLQKEKN